MSFDFGVILDIHALLGLGVISFGSQLHRYILAGAFSVGCKTVVLTPRALQGRQPPPLIILINKHMNVHDRYELTEKNVDRIPGTKSEIIFNEAVGCKKSMNHKQSYTIGLMASIKSMTDESIESVAK